MKINADEIRNTRHVHVTFEPYAVKVLLLREVAEALGISMEAAKPLRVDLSDNSTSYVRGDVNLTREEVLQSLKAGHTAEELMSLRMTALATLDRAPGDHAATALLKIVDALDGTSSGSFKTLMSDGFGGDLVEVELGTARKTGTSDVVPTPEEIERFREVAGDPDQALKPRVDARVIDEATTQAERLVRTLRRMPAVVAQVRTALHDAQAVDPDSVDVATTVRIFQEAARGSDTPGPARGPNPGTQVGTGHYTPESEELPEVQVDRTEDPATITVQSVRNDLYSVLVSLDHAAVSPTLEEVRAHVTNATTMARGLHEVLGKYSSCILTEGEGPLVPRRGPTTDVIDTAREKVKHLYERQFHYGQEPRAKDLVGLYKLLGGGDL